MLVSSVGAPLVSLLLVKAFTALLSQLSLSYHHRCPTYNKLNTVSVRKELSQPDAGVKDSL